MKQVEESVIDCNYDYTSNISISYTHLQIEKLLQKQLSVSTLGHLFFGMYMALPCQGVKPDVISVGYVSEVDD